MRSPIVLMCELDSIPECDDTFIVDFAVSMGVSQLVVGGWLGGEHTSKLNRLMEIGREEESLVYAFSGRRFRSMK